MIDADGRRICDKEVWSRSRNRWEGCRQSATVNVPSKYVCSGLDYCKKHRPNAFREKQNGNVSNQNHHF